jgi:hypothetical protein
MLMLLLVIMDLALTCVYVMSMVTLFKWKMLHRHPLLPYTLVHPMHYKDRKGEERESVLVRDPRGHVSNFCGSVNVCTVT